MIEYLQAEILLEILKNLDFEELFSIKQINKYFYYVINKFKDELARKRFEQLFFIASDYEGYKQVNFNSQTVRDKANNFPLSNNLQEKWQSTLDKQIPVLLVNTKAIVNKMEIDILNGDFVFENTELIAVRIEPFLFFSQEGSQKNEFALKLPLIPQNIEELKFVRYWLLKIFNCVFNDIYFYDFILNPEIIELLLENEEINKLKFNCQSAFILFKNQYINVWNFILDHSIISEGLNIIFYEGEENQETTEEENNFLFNLLLNEGYRIPKVILYRPNNNRILLYNNLINHLETSTDLSKIVNIIEFECEYWFRSELIVRGVEMSKSNKRKKYYKIKNINDPKIMFSILYILDEFGNYLVRSIKIDQIK